MSRLRNVVQKSSVALLLSAALSFGASCSDSGAGAGRADRPEQGVTALKVGVAGRTSVTTDLKVELSGAGGSGSKLVLVADSSTGGSSNVLAFKRPTIAPPPAFKAIECASLEDGEQALQHAIAMFALSFVKAVGSLEAGLVLETNIRKDASGELFLASNGCRGIILSDRARELAYNHVYDRAWEKYATPPRGFLDRYAGTRAEFAADAAKRATMSLAVALATLQQSGDGCEVADALLDGFQSPLCKPTDPGCSIGLEPVHDADGQPKTIEHMCKRFEVFKVKTTPGAASDAVQAAKRYLLNRFGIWKDRTNPYLVFDGLSTSLAADEIGLDPFSAENTDCWFMYPDQHYCYSEQHDYGSGSPHIVPGPYLVASPERRCDPCSWDAGVGVIHRKGGVYQCDLTCAETPTCNCLE